MPPRITSPTTSFSLPKLCNFPLFHKAYYDYYIHKTINKRIWVHQIPLELVGTPPSHQFQAASGRGRPGVVARTLSWPEPQLRHSRPPHGSPPSPGRVWPTRQYSSHHQLPGWSLWPWPSLLLLILAKMGQKRKAKKRSLSWKLIRRGSQEFSGCCWLGGAPGGSRTPDKRFRKPLLCPLSYRGTTTLVQVRYPFSWRLRRGWRSRRRALPSIWRMRSRVRPNF